MRKLIIANWKMNPLSVSEAVNLAKKEDVKNAIIAPPFVFLESVGKILKYARLAAQDVFSSNAGAYTGEISPVMLKKLGVQYIIIGHSERRRLGETDDVINKKIIAVLENGLKPILCVGEPLTVRKKGLNYAQNFVKSQLQKALYSLNSKSYILNSRLIIAYEPVWAIGTGIPDKPESAAKMHKYIKNLLATRYSLLVKVIYGGSVNFKNAKSFLKNSEIDGALVGGASLNTIEFRLIVKTVSNIKIKKT